MRTLDRKPGKYGQIKADPFLTAAKFQELERKLDRLRQSQPQAAAEVARLAEMGDFSENFAYQHAKGRLRGINQRILEIEHQLNQAEVIRPEAQTNTVELGHTVTVECEGKQKTYQILGSTETDPRRGIISHNSPIGSALLGRKVNETIEITVGSKKTTYTILTISLWNMPFG